MFCALATFVVLGVTNAVWASTKQGGGKEVAWESSRKVVGQHGQHGHLALLLIVTFTGVVGVVGFDPVPNGGAGVPFSGKVFIVGMFKTGTTSLTSALTTLGSTCGSGNTRINTTNGLSSVLHSCSFNRHVLKDELSWLDYTQVRDALVDSPSYPDILALSDQTDTTLFSDAPYLFLFREMDQRHPGSKFVLSLRHGGVDSYVRSELRMWKKLGIMNRVRAELAASHEFNVDTSKSKEFKNWVKKKLAQRYVAHVAAVRAYFAGRESRSLLEVVVGKDHDLWWKLRNFVHGPPRGKVKVSVLKGNRSGLSLGGV